MQQLHAVSATLRKSHVRTLAQVADKIGHGEQLGGILSIGRVDLSACDETAHRAAANIKVPVVRELQLEAGVVGGLDGDDVGAEVRTQQQAERLDGVGLLGLAAGQGQQRELLVGAKHDQLGAEHDAGLLLLVVVDLHGGVVRHAERHHARLVARLERAGRLLVALAALTQRVACVLRPVRGGGMRVQRARQAGPRWWAGGPSPTAPRCG